MEQFGEKEMYDAEHLRALIEAEEALSELAVCAMALRDLDDGNVEAAVSRLRVDLDKLLVMAPELYEYIVSRKT